MRPYQAVLKFCEGASSVTLLSENFARRGRRNIFEFYDQWTTQVFRSMDFYAERKYLFSVDIDFHDHPQPLALTLSLAVAIRIDDLFPDQFLWTFSGRGIHGHTLFDAEQNESFDRLSSRLPMYSIAQRFANWIKGKGIQIDTQIYHNNATIRAIGSINLKSNLYKIPITLDQTPSEILHLASIPHITKFEIPLFTDKIPQVGEPPRSDNTKFKYTAIPMQYRDYPPCIQQLLQSPYITFSTRTVLIPFLRDTGKTVEEIYDIIRTRWGEEKYKHVKRGREVERFFEHGYKTPSCVRIKELGLCPGDCGRYHPLNKLPKEE